jgi:hypothetical protein
MRKEYLSFQDSIQFIRSRHPAAEPNSSFVEQLKLVDVQLCKQRALQQPVNSSISVHECLPSSATAHRQTSRALQHPCE